MQQLANYGYITSYIGNVIAMVANSKVYNRSLYGALQCRNDIHVLYHTYGYFYMPYIVICDWICKKGSYTHIQLHNFEVAYLHV